MKRLSSVDIVAVCDIAEEKAKNAAQKFGGEAFTDLDEMLEKAKPDIVDVCVREPDHRSVVEKALDAGADVICEKTMADTMKNAQTMEDNTLPPVTGVGGLKAMQIDKAINASHEQRCWVKPY